MAQRKNCLEGKIPNISFASFKTLGIHQWLNDEVINYFVGKWCSGSSTLGLNTFFACKILFDNHDDSCVHAREGVVTWEHEERAVRWCRRAIVSHKFPGAPPNPPLIGQKNSLGLPNTWDSVFIPINENHSHWYSAYIDFRNKYIHIYDSWGETCLINEQKPVLLRKNTGLMLVSCIQ